MLEEIKSCKLKNHDEHKILQKNELVATAWRSINSDPNEHISILSKQKDGTMKDVPCPVIGVDRADQLRMQYSICCKSKKWCRYLLWFLVDLADVNDSIYLDGALCRGWGGDTYVQVEQHNIER